MVKTTEQEKEWQLTESFPTLSIRQGSASYEIILPIEQFNALGETVIRLSEENEALKQQLGTCSGGKP